MACMEVLGPARARVFTDTSTVRYEWLTDWIPAVGIDNIKAVWKQKDTVAGFRGQPAYQTAEVRPDNPDAPGVLDSTQTGAGEWCTSVESVSTPLADKFWVRFGVAYDLASGANAQADVELTVSFTRCGQVLGSVSQVLVATATTSQYVPITGWLPAIAAAQVRVAAVTRGLTGNFQWKLCCRLATTSKEEPNAWESVSDSFRGAGEECVGDLSPTSAGGHMWIQYGIEYHLSEAGNPGQASIDLAVGVRKS